MIVALVGGGSGGHIMPLLAVAHELKRLDPDTQLIYIGEKDGKFRHVVEKDGIFNEIHEVAAGKLRRYPGSTAKKILDVPTNARNARDAIRLTRGTLQAGRLLKRLRPDGIFFAGGYVGVPVGVAAHRLHIPFITHDLDAAPGLANRFIGRWASVHATGMPVELYDYPKDKTVFVGVPVSKNFQPLTPESRAGYRQELGLGNVHNVITIIGGSQGAARLNETVYLIVPEVMSQLPDTSIVHVCGTANEPGVTQTYKKILTAEQANRVKVIGFTTDLYKYTGAADVVITRAGASSVTELAAQHQAAIVVPSAELANGHQTKNAEYFKAHNVAIVLTEKELEQEPELLKSALIDLLNNRDKRAELGEALARTARPDATHALAELLLSTFGKGRA